MNGLSKPLFILAHQVGDRNFYPTYKRLLANQWQSYAQQKESQEMQLRKMVDFVWENVPYYHRLFRELGIGPEDIRLVEDLEKLPILTKDIIKENWEDFKPKNLEKMKYYTNSTGGSTGEPFKYRLQKYDRFLSGALLYRGWGYAGYELGDKMVFLAGSSLDVGTEPIISKKAHEISRNVKKLSSFDMGSDDIQSYVKTINSFKPKFLRGYASAINLFANYVAENDLDIHQMDGVFTSAEKLFPVMRRNIKSAFNCDVYDGYGLNDGGIGAYECPEHNGLHIDTERSIMEIVNKDGTQLNEGVGEVLATSLNNYAMPFIRYDTGDMGHLLEDQCSCGRGSKLLKEILGRSIDILITPEGKQVHGWFFIYMFWEYSKGIKEYQVVQKSLENIVIKIVPEDDFDEKQLNMIKSVVHSKSHGWNVEFKYVDYIEKTNAGKHKFIINNYW
ncbi:phenylacetate--CoA ligase family protein [Methanohalophilus profundi]|uniref:phenylacetate--CoA ligase family protein n=1 Tax=Methanohalophilus profundi TaxID=2138083 RepID=UPI00101D3520|nr:phenylacetate--CoA ligase family protein [Methanohalophilus profundi]